MKEVELIIKIPEELYDDIKEHGLCGYCSDREIASEAIRNGTPLPKGHGRLIDADVLADGFEDNYEFCEEVNATPTIIEADKGE